MPYNVGMVNTWEIICENGARFSVTATTRTRALAAAARHCERHDRPRPVDAIPLVPWNPPATATCDVCGQPCPMPPRGSIWPASLITGPESRRHFTCEPA